jgi:hypothetical protein
MSCFAHLHAQVGPAVLPKDAPILIKQRRIAIAEA